MAILLKDRIKTVVEELAEKGVTQVDLAHAAGVSKGTVSQWLDGGIKSIKMENALGIEERYGYSHVWLVLGRGEKKATKRGEAFSNETADRIPVRHVSFKITGGVSGFGVDYLDETSYEPLFFKRSWYDRRGYLPDNLYAITVRGDSMSPTLQDGDVVVINTADTKLSDGMVYAINYEGELVVKRLVRDLGHWWLVSDNADQRRYVRVTCDENTFVIGRVVHAQTEHV